MLRSMVFPCKGKTGFAHVVGIVSTSPFADADVCQQPADTPTTKSPGLRPLLPPTSFIYRVSFTG